MQDYQVLDEDFNYENAGQQIEIVNSTKFILLSFLTLGLYPVWWMYKSWKFLKEKDNLDVWPVARAFFAIFFIFSLLDRILKFAKSKGYEKTYSGGTLSALFVIMSFTSRLPDPLGLISILAFFTLVQPVKALNYGILHSEEYNAFEKSSYNTRQIVLIVVGILIWGLILIGLFLPEDF